MTVYYIGMDVHSRKTTICFGTDSGKVILKTEVETSREGMEGLIERIRARFPDEKIELVAGMESGNISLGAAKLLKELGVEVDVIHAREVRDKTSDKGESLSKGRDLRRELKDPHTHPGDYQGANWDDSNTYLQEEITYYVTVYGIPCKYTSKGTPN
jgi:transposase